MSDDTTCPTCGKGFDTRSGMKVHHYQVHDERLVDHETCEYCGEAFEPSCGSTGPYCSSECMGKARRQRVSLECPTCGESLDVEPSVAERTTYCSTPCQATGYENRVERECAMCGRSYTVRRSRETECCCRTCEAERRSSRPRPDDPAMLIWLLYVYEDYNYRETWRRQRAHLYPDHLSETAVKDQLKEMGVFDPQNRGLAKRLAAKARQGAFDTAHPGSDDTHKKYYPAQLEVESE